MKKTYLGISELYDWLMRHHYLGDCLAKSGSPQVFLKHLDILILLGREGKEIDERIIR